MVWTSVENQPQNSGIFKPLKHEIKLKNLLDLKYDLYKNVDKIKFEDPKLSFSRVDKIMREREKEL